jgi:hypothetical protein
LAYNNLKIFFKVMAWKDRVISFFSGRPSNYSPQTMEGDDITAASTKTSVLDASRITEQMTPGLASESSEAQPVALIDSNLKTVIAREFRCAEGENVTVIATHDARLFQVTQFENGETLTLTAMFHLDMASAGVTSYVSPKALVDGVLEAIKGGDITAWRFCNMKSRNSHTRCKRTISVAIDELTTQIRQRLAH